MTRDDYNSLLRVSKASAELEIALFGDYGEARTQIEALPWLTLPPGFSFKVTFPFGGAAARFRVCKTGAPDRSISIYLDVKNVLGYCHGPYWEAYPIDGDAARFSIEDGEGLIAAIVRELEKPVERAFTDCVALPAPKSPWDVLGVAPGATEAEIDAAYRAKAKTAHPDNGGTAAAMQELNEARKQMKGRVA
ncbi:MAG: hypothetical protein BGO49_24775 [Planctomycetales bacterium 71-10]|nr:MAG: hypothetical protein BGO49_24775 [Planctomycetales bacterium 71-10]